MDSTSDYKAEALVPRCDGLALKGGLTHPLTQKNIVTQQIPLQSLNQIATCTQGCGVYIILKIYNRSYDDCHLFFSTVGNSVEC